MKNILKEIDRKKAVLASKRPLTEGEVQRLHQDFATEFTYNSVAIEGSTLTLRETGMVLRGLTIDKKPLREHLEAAGHKEAFDFVLELVQENKEITESVIQQIHYLVLADRRQDRGRYRRIPVTIQGANVHLAQPYMIAPKMEGLLIDLAGSTEHIVPKLAKFHIEFEQIHPFIDGNGRTERLLVNLLLMQEGYPPIDIKFTDRKEYYNAFENYNSGEGTTAMQKLFAKYLNERLGWYIEILSDKE